MAHKYARKKYFAGGPEAKNAHWQEDQPRNGRINDTVNQTRFIIVHLIIYARVIYMGAEHDQHRVSAKAYRRAPVNSITKKPREGEE